MLNDTFANRLKKAMELNDINQTQLAKKTNLDKSLISNYLSGNYKAKQDNLLILAKALNVTEPWLMGYDVPLNDDYDDHDELSILFSKNRDILTQEDEEFIRFTVLNRRRKIDEMLDGKSE